MRGIEIIAIGNELLTGKTVNTNAAKISQSLRTIGLRVTRHSVLPDDKEILKRELKEALERAEIVITTGGLGPTFDDLSKQVVKELFHSSFFLHSTLYKDLRKRYKKFPSDLKQQATVPSNALIFFNPIGTAPGLAFPKENPRLFMLPGVPKEMEALLEKDVLPHLKKHFRREEKHFEKTLHFCLLWENAIEPFLKKMQKRYPKVEMGIYPEYATVTAVFRTQAKQKNLAEKRLTPLLNKVKEHFKTYVYTSSSGLLEEAICDSFVTAKKTLVLAESCTGGAIAARLTSIPGASNYFLGSFVTYSNALKETVLHISPATLKKQGSVSKEAVREMLEGAFALTQADYGIAISGIAGPTGGSPKKPIGTVWAAIGKRGEEPDIGLIPISGIRGRQVVIQYSCTYVLGALYRKFHFGISVGF